MPGWCVVPFCGKKCGGHLFPKNPQLRKKWKIAVRRHEKWEPSKYSTVCRMHFKEDDFVNNGSILQRKLKQHAVPSVFRWTMFRNTEKYEKQAKERSERARRRTVAKDSPDMFVDYIEQEYTALNECEVSTEDVDLGSSSVVTTGMKTSSVAVQTDPVPKTSLSVEKLQDDDKAMHFYTGLESYSKFRMVLATLGPAAHELHHEKFSITNISVENQFLVFLVKLRRHMTNFELAFLFEISETTVSNIFMTWLAFVSKQWRELNIWPDQDLVRFYAPSNFQAQYPSTRVVIDATEMQVQRPSHPSAQRATFSSYKQRNTVKALVGATPGGLVSYVSPAYAGGSASDRQIVERSGLMRLCDRGDSIMADKGFNVQDIFAPFDVKINIPTFFSKRNRLTGEIVLRDRKISSKRVHIERIIGLAKTFKILKDVLTTTETAMASDIVFVCFMLCNFKDNIVSRHA